MYKQNNFLQITDPERHLINSDIVFVHGLHGQSGQTWRGVDNSAWPQHLLPEDIPFARIFTFGFSVITAVKDLSANVQSTLCSHLEEFGKYDKLERPLILIAHSLGGLIVQHALLQESQDEESHIMKRLKGLLFLGTPNFDNLDQWTSFCSSTARIIKAPETPKETDLIKLHHLSCKYRQWSMQNKDLDIRTWYFCETLPVYREGILVPKGFARPGKADIVALHSDHLSIARCNGPWEQHYQIICARINSIIHGRDLQSTEEEYSKRARSSDCREAVVEDAEVEKYTNVKSLIWYALTLDDQGHPKSAEERFEQVLRQWPAVKAQEQSPLSNGQDKVILFCRGKKSSIQRVRGQYEEAEVEAREVLKEKTRLLGPGHELTLQCTRSLALTLIAQEKLREAFILLRNTLEKEAQDPYQDVSQARLISVLSTIYQALDKPQLSVLLARNVLCAFETLLGVDHPFTLLRASSLADALVHNRDYCQAEEIDRHVLDLLEQIFGTDYPPALRVAKKLADILRFQAKFEEAASLYERTYEKQKRQLGAGHPNTISTQCGIAAICALTYRLIDSEDLLTNITPKRTKFRANDYNMRWVEHALDIVRLLLRNQDPQPSSEELSQSEERLDFFRQPWRPERHPFEFYETSTLPTDDNEDRPSPSIKLRFAALQNDEKSISSYLDKAQKDQSVGGFCGTPLHAACFAGNLKIVRMLLASDTEDPNAVGGIFGTPLQAAAFSGDVDIVDALLEAGADPNKTGYFGTTPLQTAVIGNHSKIVKTLVSNKHCQADPDHIDHYFGTALQEATLACRSDLVDILKEAGADTDIRAGLFGTALRASALRGDPYIARSLLRSSSNLSSHYEGRQAYNMAIAHGHREVARTILESISSSSNNSRSKAQSLTIPEDSSLPFSKVPSPIAPMSKKGSANEKKRRRNLTKNIKLPTHLLFRRARQSFRKWQEVSA